MILKNQSKHKQFKMYYTSTLLPQYQKIETLRLKLIERFNKYLKFVMASLIIVCFSLYYFLGRHAIYSFLGLLFIVITFALKLGITDIADIRKDIDNYYTVGKKQIMPLILKFFGEFKYGKFPVNFEILNKSELFPMFTKYGTMIKFDDCFIGKYKNTSVHIAERTLGCFSNDLCIYLKFNKKFKGKTVTHTKKYDSGFNMILYFFLFSLVLVGAFWYLFGWQDGLPGIIYFSLAAIVYGIILYKNYYSTRKRAKFESLKFSKRWNVDTTDQTESRYILTPAFIERISQLQKQFPRTGINFSFFENKVMIVIRSYINWFETTPLCHTVLDFQRINRCFNQLESIFNTIEYLDLLNENLPQTKRSKEKSVPNKSK